MFLDTEFIDTGRIIQPISIALVAETGAEYYAVFADIDLHQLARRAWLKVNVAPHLPVRSIASGWTWDPHHHDFTAVKPRTAIAQDIVAFFTPLKKPQVWAYFSPFDTIVLTQLYGPLDELPSVIPAFTHDLMQEAERTGIPTPRQKAGTHHALLDARHNLTVARTIGLLQSRALSGR
ncbi:3'-5' exoribonuclease [Actinoplanes sp. NPDC051411]|uniref:3'-5' exoribonuclease domain-containing protein n=1 Tax=Actinoplanes sp. NPDC051411 TaxID=3155522 RepID=UPI0034296204